MWKRWPRRCLGTVWLPLCTSISSSTTQTRSDVFLPWCALLSHDTDVWADASGAQSLWWELLVMRGGTRWEALAFPKGRQINYSAWSFASTRLRWQHMRGINSCNIHERARRSLGAVSWVRGARTSVERRMTAHNGRIANWRVAADCDIFVFQMQVVMKTTNAVLATVSSASTYLHCVLLCGNFWILFQKQYLGFIKLEIEMHRGEKKVSKLMN